MSRRFGITRVEVAVILVAIGLIVAIVAVIVYPSRRDRAGMQDARQLKQIHAAYATFASDADPSGLLPLPGRLALLSAAQEAAVEDYSVNHTANIYSMAIMQNYLTPQILVSPLETNPDVRVKGEIDVEYDFDSPVRDEDFAKYDRTIYDPAAGVLWDESFVMRIDDPAIGANASYAHEAAVGDRRAARWTNSSDGTNPVFGTRAPSRPGATPPRSWTGNFVFGDNHVETLRTFSPRTPDEISLNDSDNIFAADLDHPNGPQAAADIFLAIYISATEFSVEDVYDKQPEPPVP